MPVSDHEWREGTFEPDEGDFETTPVGEGETTRERVAAFLEANADEAFTAREVLLGIGFDAAEDPDAVQAEVSKVSPRVDVFGERGHEVEERVGDLATGEASMADVEAALDDLVEEGSVVARDIDTDDGAETHYRHNRGNERVDG